MLFLLIVPSLIVIPMSFSDSQYLEFPPKNWSLRWYENYFSSGQVGMGFNDWIGATWTSIKVAVLTIFVATPIGTMAAYGLINSVRDEYERQRMSRVKPPAKINIPAEVARKLL